jgi:hypothetical protein
MAMSPITIVISYLLYITTEIMELAWLDERTPFRRFEECALHNFLPQLNERLMRWQNETISKCDRQELLCKLSSSITDYTTEHTLNVKLAARRW